jgi:ApaG protein
MAGRSFYYRETSGIRITVRPSYLASHSSPADRRHVFAYHVRIENVGEQPAQLLTRRWLIHDDAGDDTIVEGEGVIGQQPEIAHGAVHVYQSWCLLKGPSGWMEGSYHFRREDGTEFDALIPRFYLDARATAGPVS